MVVVTEMAMQELLVMQSVTSVTVFHFSRCWREILQKNEEEKGIFLRKCSLMKYQHLQELGIIKVYGGLFLSFVNLFKMRSIL